MNKQISSVANATSAALDSGPMPEAAPTTTIDPTLYEALEVMPHGLVVWDDDMRCIVRTNQMIEIMEIRATDLFVGMQHSEFLQGSIDRGELTVEGAKAVVERIKKHEVFQFDRQMRSGRIVSTHAIPHGKRGFVVSFTDVTEIRKKAAEMDEAIRAVDEARDQVAAALEQEKSLRYQARVLSDFGEWLQTCKSLDELYHIIQRYMSKVLPDTLGELYIYSNSRDVLDGALSWGDINLTSHIEADCCWALRRGHNYNFGHQIISFECQHVLSSEPKDLQQYICIPIMAHGDTVGLLHIRYSDEAIAKGKIKDLVSFGAKCGELVSLAIANVRLRDELHEQSNRDPLTGLNNRRSCLEYLRQQVAINGRTSDPFSIISIDADHFKHFNDSYGHDAGDAVLQAISAEMQREIVPQQMACRFGGEEFLMVLPQIGIADAVKFADELRKRIGATQIQFANQLLPSVTVSCGVASFPSTADNIQALLREADVALYLAKDQGRNRVVQADGALPKRTVQR